MKWLQFINLNTVVEVSGIFTRDISILCLVTAFSTSATSVVSVFFSASAGEFGWSEEGAWASEQTDLGHEFNTAANCSSKYESFGKV